MLGSSFSQREQSFAYQRERLEEIPAAQDPGMWDTKRVEEIR
jgi:hypothetical protein